MIHNSPKLQFICTHSIKEAVVQELQTKSEAMQFSFSTSTPRESYFDTYSAANCLVFDPKATAYVLESAAEKNMWQQMESIITKVWQAYKQQDQAFGLQFQLDMNTLFNLKLSNSFSEKTFQQALGKILDFLKMQSSRRGYGNPYFVYFEEGSNQWKKVEVLDLFEEEEDDKPIKNKNTKGKSKKRK